MIIRNVKKITIRWEKIRSIKKASINYSSLSISMISKRPFHVEVLKTNGFIVGISNDHTIRKIVKNEDRKTPVLSFRRWIFSRPRVKNLSDTVRHEFVTERSLTKVSSHWATPRSRSLPNFRPSARLSTPIFLFRTRPPSAYVAAGCQRRKRN